jgi:putative heme iron utilization protein
MRILMTTLAAVALSAGAATAADAPLCATPEQAKQVQELYQKGGMLPMIANRTLKMNDAIIASALPAGQAVGTSAKNFPAIWNELAGMEGVTLVMKGGNVYEIRGKIPKGEPSKSSQYFNIENDVGLSGHLRPDLYGAIYALAIPGRIPNSVSRGIMFVDRETGDSAFMIAPGLVREGTTPPPAVLAQFEKVTATIKSFPPACPAK